MQLRCIIRDSRNPFCSIDQGLNAHILNVHIVMMHPKNPTKAWLFHWPRTQCTHRYAASHDTEQGLDFLLTRTSIYTQFCCIKWKWPWPCCSCNQCLDVQIVMLHLTRLTKAWLLNSLRPKCSVSIYTSFYQIAWDWTGQGCSIDQVLNVHILLTDLMRLSKAWLFHWSRPQYTHSYAAFQERPRPFCWIDHDLNIYAIMLHLTRLTKTWFSHWKRP